MDKITPDESFLARWIEGKLTDQELSEFKKTKAYKEFDFINKQSQKLESPKVDVEAALNKVKSQINTNTKPKGKVIKLWMSIAASVAIIISAYSILNLKTTYSTGIGEKKTVMLADGSVINLNANSTLSHQKFFWLNNKTVNFKGEAYFTITKGDGFKVNTTRGEVAVLGTQFNIKDRTYFYAVNCYEGKVSYTQKNNPIYLTKGQKVTLDIQTNQVKKSVFENTEPTWKKNISVFKNTPLKQVLNDFKNIYGVTFDYQNIQNNVLFTGNFIHTDINIALQTIFVPLNISYQTAKNNTVILKQK